MVARDNAIDTEPPAFVEQVVLAFSVIGTIATLAWVLWFCRYGLDLSDESFYIVWISNPFLYGISSTQFGFVYHPLYELLGGNIAALRQANILLTFCLAWVLCSVFFRNVFQTQRVAFARLHIISASFATTSLLSLVVWLPTPSYNSLALQALLIAATGLVLADSRTSRASLIGWLLIGVGGWLAFMAKPTTAAGLGVGSGIYLLMAGKLNVRLVALSLITALGLLFLSAFAIDGSIPGFIDRLRGGVEVGSAMGGGHTMAQLLRLDDFRFSLKERDLLLAGTAVFVSAAYFSQAQSKSLLYGGALLSISFVLIELAIVGGLIEKPLNAGSFQSLLIWSVPFAGMLVGVLLSRFQLLLQISRGQWALSLVLLTFPHSFAFGTNSNYWLAGAGAAIFWVVSGLALLGSITPGHRPFAYLLPLALGAQLITVALIHFGIDAPYRQPHHLNKNDYTLEIGRPGSELVLSKDVGQYFSDAVEVAKLAGFKEGTPMIDLTGQSPGTLYAMGARNIGQAWTIGGYPGSNGLAQAMLKRVSCEELSVAWVLAEPGGAREISSEILRSYGANMASDFEVVGTFKTAKGAGGFQDVRVQKLFKPVRPITAANSSCIAARQ
nr:hypothetical protein [uncultured bacterium]